VAEPPDICSKEFSLIELTLVMESQVFLSGGDQGTTLSCFVQFIGGKQDN